MLDAGYQQVGRVFLCFCIRKRMKSMHWHVPNEIWFRLHRFYLLCRTGCHAGDDLKRRDLTINALAQDDNGGLSTRTTVWAICKIVCCAMFPRFWRRSVTRVARSAFCCAFAHLSFRIADETLALMREMTLRVNWNT